MTLGFVITLLSPFVGVMAILARPRRANLITGLTLTTSWLGVIGLILANQGTPLTITLGRWLAVDTIELSWAFYVDTLALTMLAVVTTISLLIHFYAIGYMHSDPHKARFTVYFSLFVGFMIILVSADSLPILFIGWEGVGLCSFLLIGFWFEKPANSRAAQKAFWVNRIGDMGLLMAMALLYRHGHSLILTELASGLEEKLVKGSTLAVAIGFLLFLAVVAKSAQFPLYIWLPDAMAGPTPASALIHAATMVTAGIYLVVRLHYLFELAPLVMHVMIGMGVITALWGALLALAQTDIKRVLAYSTISQLGYMVAALGMGNYLAGMFHLVTHAFFKALLFLAAGAVIHALQHHATSTNPQNMLQMGGLRRQMPITALVYGLGGGAMLGLPPLAGFFSKDEILATAHDHYPLAYWGLLAGVFFTAFYITRQYRLVFGDTARTSMAEQAHEVGYWMVVPMIILAFMASTGGLLMTPLAEWLGHSLPLVSHTTLNWIVALDALLLSLLGMGMGWRNSRRFPRFTWRLEAIYQLFIIKPFNASARWLAWADIAVFHVPDRFIRAIAESGILAWADIAVLHGLEDRMISQLHRTVHHAQHTEKSTLVWNVGGLIAGIGIIFAFFWLWSVL